jgi:GNAT superfamily N-acetyltransferase
MISDFNVEEGSPGRITSEGVIDLCFSDQPLYAPLVAEDRDVLVGYALITRYFDTEPCAWCSYMQDLYVVPDRRSEGVGRLLITAAARHTLKEGRHELLWHVRDHNVRGRAFYARIGGKEQTPIPVTLSSEALRDLAEEAD